MSSISTIDYLARPHCFTAVLIWDVDMPQGEGKSKCCIYIGCVCGYGYCIVLSNEFTSPVLKCIHTMYMYTGTFAVSTQLLNSILRSLQCLLGGGIYLSVAAPVIWSCTSSKVWVLFAQQTHTGWWAVSMLSIMYHSFCLLSHT